MFCTQCGSQLFDDALFCWKCGAPVGKVGQDVAQPPDTSPAEAMAPAANLASDAASVSATDFATPAPKRSKAPIAIAAAIVTAVAIAACFGVYAMFFSPLDISGIYTLRSTANATYDERGVMTRVTRTGLSTKTSATFNGEVTFEYKRVFTSKDAPDVKQPVMMGDLTAHEAIVVPLSLDLFGPIKQSPIALATLSNGLVVSSISL